MTIREKLDELGQKLDNLNRTMDAVTAANRATIDAYARKEAK